MGADQGGQGDEHPAHQVLVAAYWLDKTEVTNRAYQTCVDAGACRPHDVQSAQVNHLGTDPAFRSPEQPISSISWDDARRSAFGRASGSLPKRSGRKRLGEPTHGPTRGGTTHLIPSGSLR